MRTDGDHHWAESEPRGTLGRGNWLNPEIIPKRRGTLLPEAAAGRAVPRLCSRARMFGVKEVSPSCCFGLLFGQSEVPGSFLRTLPHGLHEAGEAHVFGLLQASHQPLLHDGHKFLIAQLPVA